MPNQVYLLEVPVTDGNTVLVEVTDSDAEKLVPAARGDLPVRAEAALRTMLDKLQPTLRTLADWAKASAPTEVAVEFGLKFGTKANVVIASGTTEVNFVVKMTWS
jgi:hypothetical protein